MRCLNKLPSVGPSLLTIGVFDGVHLGHQSVIHTLVSHALSLDLFPVVYTFKDHPSKFLNPRNSKKMITTLEHRLRLIEALGVEYIVIQDFDAPFSKQTAQEFLDLTHASIDFKSLVLGHDSKIGSDRLKAPHIPADVISIPPFTLEGVPISSSLIRQKLQEGDIKTVSSYLGRPYSIFGKIVKGQNLGAKLGTPTLNIEVGDLALPPLGVWEVKARFGTDKVKAIANLGFAPTVGREGPPLLEVHLLHKMAEPILEFIEVEFQRYIRPEIKFENLAELKKQIQKDISSLG